MTSRQRRCWNYGAHHKMGPGSGYKLRVGNPYKWPYKLGKWPYKLGFITLLVGVIYKTPFVTRSRIHLARSVTSSDHGSFCCTDFLQLRLVAAIASWGRAFHVVVILTLTGHRRATGFKSTTATKMDLGFAMAFQLPLEKHLLAHIVFCQGTHTPPAMHP